MTSPIEIVFKDTQEIAMFGCSTCGVCHTVKREGDRAREAAEKCCVPPLCACGETLEHYWSACKKCRAIKDAAAEKKRFDAAEKLIEQTSDIGMLYCWDEYFSSWEDIIGRCEKPEEVPQYAYATETVTWSGLCVDNIMERANEEYNVEDRDIEDELTELDALREFIKAWNARQNVHWFEADFTRVVLRPANYMDDFPEQDKDGTTAQGEAA